MKDKGIAHIGIGAAKGDDKANEAVQKAVTSPLLETTIKGASHIIINIAGDIGLMEANEAASYVQELAGETANIIFGARYEDSEPDTCTITVIATGLEEESEPPVEAPVFNNTVKPQGNINTVTKNINTSSVRPIISTSTRQTAATSTIQPRIQTTQTRTGNVSKIGETKTAQNSGSTIKIPDFLRKKD
jgi:Cell division GTPase